MVVNMKNEIEAALALLTAEGPVRDAVLLASPEGLHAAEVALRVTRASMVLAAMTRPEAFATVRALAGMTEEAGDAGPRAWVANRIMQQIPAGDKLAEVTRMDKAAVAR